jgi:hypothetical protein
MSHVVAVVLLMFGAFAQVAPAPSPEPTPSPIPPLSADLVVVPPSGGRAAPRVLITLTNRTSMDVLTEVTVAVGPGPAETPRRFADLETGQSRAEQIDVQQEATSAYAMISYQWRGHADSLARSASLTEPPPNPLVVGLLTGGIGIVGAILGALIGNVASYVFGRRRDADNDRRTWFTLNAPHYRAFLSSWDRSPDPVALRTAYTTLRTSGADLRPTFHRAYDAASVVFDRTDATVNARRDAAQSLADEIDQLLEYYGPALDR